MKRRSFVKLIICLFSAMVISGCNSKEAEIPADVPESKQEVAGETETPESETSVPDVSEPEEEKPVIPKEE